MRYSSKNLRTRGWLRSGGVLGLAGEPIECGDLEAQRLAHFARGGAAAIGDDVGGHGGSKLSEPPVDVLDDAARAFRRWEVEIDVGPLAALFGKEALEEQVHAHGIDGRDFERVAHRAIGGRAASLGQDGVLLQKRTMSQTIRK